VYFAWTLPRHERSSIAFLTTAYCTGLVILVAVFEVAQIDFKTWLLQPGAVLPPNEIMGRDWPVGLAMGAFGLALWLNIVPSALMIVVWLARVKSARSE
jgi:hypothetical protein